MEAAGDELFAGLSGVKRPLPEPAAGEYSRQAPPPEAGAGHLETLKALARGVVDAVVDLSGHNLDRSDLEKVVKQEADRHLAEMGASGAAVRAKLVSLLPGILNLPTLSALSENGLELQPAQVEDPGGAPFVKGSSPAFCKLLSDLEKVAATDLPVLLMGETGTGKELLARRLHRLSPRREGPFVAVNCAALAENLMESEMFGHEKGAFTGAERARTGYVRAAKGGTLFLDEIGEAKEAFQVRLLRLLTDRKVVPVGSHRGVPVDFRLVTASHRDLALASASGGFNSALFYRINVVPFRLPPLRERKEDIPALVRQYLNQANRMSGKHCFLDQKGLTFLKGRDWPGNLRELHNLIQRAAALSDGGLIPAEELDPGPGRAGASPKLPGLEEILAEVEGIPAARVAALARGLAASGGGWFVNRDLRQSLGCSDSSVKKFLSALVRAGVLVSEGDKKGRRYRLVADQAFLV